MQAQVQTTIVNDYLTFSRKRITVMQGGTRSGKTYNILLFFILKLLGEKGKTFTVCRSSLNTIKGTVLRDFIEILLALGLYDEKNHNKTDSTYNLCGNLVEFISTDQPRKIRGRKRDYLFINEANEISYEAWLQLVFRTTNKIVLDYNPSDEFNFIYDQVIPRRDSDFFITTYLDNPFLPLELINEIERLKDADESYWQVYGLGQKGISKDTIFTHWKLVKKMPDVGETFYGMDFGFNNPTSLIKVTHHDGINYARQMLYQNKLTTSQLIDELKILGIGRSSEIYADPARPETIEEISKAGFNITAAVNDVYDGIQKVKSMPLRITEDSSDLIKEIKFYKWKMDKEGRKLDEPVKFNDHACDGLRYGIMSRFTGNAASWVAF